MAKHYEREEKEIISRRLRLLLTLAILAFIGILVWVIYTFNPARPAAKKIAGIFYTVVNASDVQPEKFQSGIGLFDPKGNKFIPLDPCTDDQGALKVGDQVKFIALETSLNPKDSDSKNFFCYLKIRELKIKG